MKTYFAIMASMLLMAGSVAVGGEEDGVEVTIGGQYRVMSNASNFGWHAATIPSETTTTNFFNQRFRTWLTVEADENVTGYLEIEGGHTWWGDAGAGGDFDFPKAATFEIRRAYITYEDDTLGEFSLGILPWSDSFGDVLASSDWDFNVGGLIYKGTLGDLAAVRATALQLADTDAPGAALGDAALYALDLDIEDLGLGLSIYYVADNGHYSYGAVTEPTGVFGGPGVAYDSADDIWVGLRAKRKIGEIDLRGFAILNSGGVDVPGSSNWTHSGFAGGIHASTTLRGITLGLQGLLSSGNDGDDLADSDEFRTIAQGVRDNYGAQGYWSFLSITSPRGPSDVNDLGVSLQNRGLGLKTVQANAVVPLDDDSKLYFAVGWLQSAEDNPTNRENDMGIEVVAEYQRRLSEHLGLEVGAAYLFIGDFFEDPADTDPDDLIEIYARVQLEF